MTVASLDTKIIYQGNGLATSFAVPFKVTAASQLSCRLVVNGQEIEIFNFAVNGIDTGAVSVTYPSSGQPMTWREKLVIYRLLPLVQEVDLVEYGPFHAETHERKFDELVMIDQQQQEQISRAILVDMNQGNPPTAQEFYSQVKQFSDAAAASASASAASAQNAQAAANLAQSYLPQITQAGDEQLSNIHNAGAYYVDKASMEANRAENAASSIQGFADNAVVFFAFAIDAAFNLMLTKSQDNDYIKIDDYNTFAIWPVQVRPYVDNGLLLLELPFQPPYEG